jgi:hypothetical protein
MARATAITGWEVDLPRLSALHAVSCMDDHANHRGLMHGIKNALIGMCATRGMCGRTRAATPGL